MHSEIYTFSMGCAELLNGCENGTEIFINLVFAGYLTVNFPDGNERDTREEFKKNLNIVDNIMPGPTVRADFLCAGNEDVTEVTERILALDKSLFFKNPELIGWMYQYFNQKKREAAYEKLRKNIKISGASLAPATQIFTPKWITRYLTENAILRTAGAEDYGQSEGKYFIADARGRLDLSIANPLEMKLIDPCMGCGHMLLGAFEVLMELYALHGIDKAEAANRILGKNLYGLDVDPEAVRIGSFALLMKAAEYTASLTRFPSASPSHTNRCAQTGKIKCDAVYNPCIDKMNLFAFEDCSEAERELGSLLEPGDGKSKKNGANKLLSQNYDIVVTNPPYMGNHNMSEILLDFVKKTYPLSKTDLSTVFMERAFKLCKPRGIVAMINISSWLFLPTYEGFRDYLIRNKTILNMSDLGQGVFGRENISRTVAFAAANFNEAGYVTTFAKIHDNKDALSLVNDKEEMFFDCGRRYYRSAEHFLCIPKKMFAYSLSDEMLNIMNNAHPLSYFGKPRQGLKTGDNARFVRMWHEVPRSEICFDAASREEAAAGGYKWFPYNKAGESRKWYGNNRYIVNWQNDGEEIRGFKDAGGRLRSRPQNMNCFFKSSVSWNMVSDKMSARYIPSGFIFDGAGGGIFSEHSKYILGFLNSRVAESFLEITSQSINYNVGQIADLPMIVSESRYAEVCDIVEECIRLSKDDWDESEASWDFEIHPLVKIAKGGCMSLYECCEEYEKIRNERYAALKKAEGRLNITFAEIYATLGEAKMTSCISGFEQGEAKPSLLGADAVNAVKGLLSFALGCVFGRYNCPGFKPGLRNEIDICTGGEDAVALFEEFVASVFGHERLAENMNYAALVLGRHNGREPKVVIGEYLSKGFIKDHEKDYLKKPIYARRGKTLIIIDNCAVIH